MIFRDRTEAGRLLARELPDYSGRSDVIVLGLPRGGVPVAYEIAQGLRAPLDVFLVRKLGAPGHEELAMGAIASGGVRVLNEDVVRALRVSAASIEETAEAEQRELDRREALYRPGRPLADLRQKTVILVDDGLATGYTMRAAVTAAGMLRPAAIVVAVPVASAEACEELRSLADRVVCMHTPELFGSVGQWYQDFTQTTDDEVSALLALAGERSSKPGSASP